VGRGPPSESGIILPALRRLVPNLLLGCASVLAAALAVEGALRLFWPQELPFFSSLFVEDRAVGLRHRPGARGSMASETGPVPVRINSRGYRGGEHPWDGPSGFRILVLGDSFTFGFGVGEDDAYPVLLERALAARHAQVINAGLAGMGPDNEARLLAADGPGLRPDLVLVGFYVGNDLIDAATGVARTRLRGGAPTVPDSILQRWYRPLRPGRILPEPLARPAPAGLDLPLPFKDALRQHSHLYRLITGRVGRLQLAWRGPAAGAATQARVEEFNPFRQEAFCLKSYPPEFDEAWQKAKDALGQINAWCGGHGARLALVVIPTEAQVYPERWDDVRRRFVLRDEDFDLDKPQRILAAHAAAGGLTLIDLLPVLRAARATGGPLYSRTDIHWTPRGHQVAADEILRRLDAARLLPPI
jgi:acetyltransferase AlgX (SGNH hydrolase-like protein)